MKFQRKGDVREALLHISQDGASIASVRAQRDIDAARDGVMLDQVRGRLNGYIGYIPQTHVATTRRVNEQITDTADAVTSVGRAHHNHTEHLLCLEEAASFNACDKCRGYSPYVTRLEPETLGFVKIDLDLNLWHIYL